jgi:hypothetical protein
LIQTVNDAGTACVYSRTLELAPGQEKRWTYRYTLTAPAKN